MKNHLVRKTHVFLSSLLIFMLHLPFVFANTKPNVQPLITGNVTGDAGNKLETITSDANLAIYENLHLNDLGLSEEAYRYAIKGYDYLRSTGKIANEHVITIADFSKSSNQKRLFVIDLDNGRVLFNTYVAHGIGSGREMANKFSNTPESLQSSPGFYITSGTYTGRNGFSMHLLGMEKGINDKASERAIVMHGAPYVSKQSIEVLGYLGRSWGCPAVPEKMNKPIIEEIKNGSCLFIYSNSAKYLERSNILNS